jgi:hypothetical protein
MKIFVSYRRADSQHPAARISERLVKRFGKSNVFIDVESLRLGEDFRDAIREAVGQCDALVAVIGDSWLDAMDSSGRRRLRAKTDFVRLEVEAALSRRIPLVPVLVGQHPMPRAADLPSSLKRLAFCQGLTVRPDPHFSGDVDYLLNHLESVPDLGENETSIFDFLVHQVDWASFDHERKESLKLALFALVSCVEGRQINTDKLAQLATVVCGGELHFDHKV